MADLGALATYLEEHGADALTVDAENLVHQTAIQAFPTPATSNAEGDLGIIPNFQRPLAPAVPFESQFAIPSNPNTSGGAVIGTKRARPVSTDTGAWPGTSSLLQSRQHSSHVTFFATFHD